LPAIEAAFAELWNGSAPVIGAAGSISSAVFLPFVPSALSVAAAGEVALRVVATTPGTLAVLRLDQLVAAAARRTLWLTDAYFAGIPPYIQALRAAARDGVDVRLLVPGASDISILRPLSQAGYRPLLESGVRVFEWRGSMLHAKTAVADGRWARVGSSNLNMASWVGNYELDALIEDESFATKMEQMFEADIEDSTEIVLRHDRRTLGAAMADSVIGHTLRRREDAATDGVESKSGGASRAAAGALRIGRTVGAALTEKRVLATTEARIVAVVAVVALALAVCVVLWPWVAAGPIAVFLTWVALVLFTRAAALRRERRRRGLPQAHIARTPGDAAASGSGTPPAA
jgi:cardiolipin synthase